MTAGASGIGYALAEAFYAEGYKVWIIDVSENDLKKCPKNWEQTRLDVSDENAMSDLFSTINNKWGCLLYTSPSPRDQRGSRMPSSA